MFDMLCLLHKDDSCTVEFTMEPAKFKTLFDAQNIKRIEILGVRLYSGALRPRPPAHLPPSDPRDYCCWVA